MGTDGLARGGCVLRTQNPVLVREWEFDPPSGHQQFIAAAVGLTKVFLRSGGDQIVRKSKANSSS